jgi:hypothetical protein
MAGVTCLQRTPIDQGLGLGLLCSARPPPPPDQAAARSHHSTNTISASGFFPPSLTSPKESSRCLFPVGFPVIRIQFRLSRPLPQIEPHIPPGQVRADTHMAAQGKSTIICAVSASSTRFSAESFCSLARRLSYANGV